MAEVLQNDDLAAHAAHPPIARIVGTILIVFAVMVAGLAGSWWSEVYRANWGVVVPGQIYRSAQMSPWLLRRKLEDNKIGVIIFLSHDDINDTDVQAEKRIAQEENVQFLNFPMMGDGVAKPEMYTLALNALCDANRAGKTVLVHCHSGAQRTGGVVAVYRMLVQKLPPEQALAEMVHYGHDPKKNLTLIPFLNQNIGEWATALVKGGAIQKVPDRLPMLIPNNTP